jgi:hypothetical protein
MRHQVVVVVDEEVLRRPSLTNVKVLLQMMNHDVVLLTKMGPGICEQVEEGVGFAIVSFRREMLNRHFEHVKGPSLVNVHQNRMSQVDVGVLKVGQTANLANVTILNH